MGYYTHYDLEVSSSSGTCDSYDIIKELREGCDSAKYSFDKNGDSEGEVKWYGHELDLKEFSIKFKGILFTLSGSGEESGDIWKKYFFNGKVQIERAQITFGDFDTNKLT